jgi:protocatechuate 3,4-dioxygenase alpha subunit
MDDTQFTPSPGQTVGPFFHFALEYPGCNALVSPGSPGAVRLHGAVTDGNGDPVPDALLEIWQAGPEGRPVTSPGHIARDGSFTGFGRAATDDRGEYSFWTLRPGATAPGAAPFIAVTVVARGLLDRLFTRAYPPTDAAAADSFLTALTPEQRSTLMVTEEADGSLRFDIALQGSHETVFLDFESQTRGEHADA